MSLLSLDLSLTEGFWNEFFVQDQAAVATSVALYADPAYKEWATSVENDA